tara:strand:+ start:804 stop:1163 length:360 start_codon:yes stop_codon:yes gene_type:complete
MIIWTKKSLFKRKKHWVSKEDVEKCLQDGKKVRSKPKHTDQTATWLASLGSIRVRFVEKESNTIVIDLYKQEKMEPCRKGHAWKAEKRVHNKGKGKYVWFQCSVCKERQKRSVKTIKLI